MKSSIVSIILILAAIGIFIGVTDPQYAAVKQVKANVADLNEALDKSNAIIAKRGDLEKQYNSFSDNDLAALSRLLPDNVDNVQLVLDMNGIARNHGMALRNIQIQDPDTQGANAAGQTALGPNQSPVGSITLSFNITGSYASFVSFLQDLEQSLRIVDVVGISFQSNSKGVYDYSVTVRTYWLK